MIQNYVTCLRYECENYSTKVYCYSSRRELEDRCHKYSININDIQEHNIRSPEQMKKILEAGL